MRRGIRDERVGVRRTRLEINFLEDGQRAAAIRDVRVPIQPRHVAGQHAGLATIAVAILLKRPPRVVNRRRCRVGDKAERKTEKRNGRKKSETK